MADNKTTEGHDPKPSNSELMASAKVVSDGMTGQEADTGKIAVAACEILDAAAKYGIVDETQGVGKYIDQAGDYLHQYEITHTTTTTTDASGIITTTESTTTTKLPDDDKK